MSARARCLLPALLAATGLALLTGARAEVPAPATPTPDTPFSEEKTLAKLKSLIAGREQEPAEAVFDSIEVLEGVPAGRLLRIMELGYSRSLEVTCTHCHTPQNFAANDRPAKRTARGMARVVARLNGELLPAIVETEGSEPTVDCTTCHRGQKKPALRLESAGG